MGHTAISRQISYLSNIICPQLILVLKIEQKSEMLHYFKVNYLILTKQSALIVLLYEFLGCVYLEKKQMTMAMKFT